MLLQLLTSGGACVAGAIRDWEGACTLWTHMEEHDWYWEMYPTGTSKHPEVVWIRATVSCENWALPDGGPPLNDETRAVYQLTAICEKHQTYGIVLVFGLFIH